MRYAYVILCQMMLLTTLLGGQSSDFTVVELVPVQQRGKWGYIDGAGKQVIEPRFRGAGFFSQGLAAVKLDNKWAFIDQSGNIMIKPQFTPFSVSAGQTFTANVTLIVLP
ncbi:MAG: WG repeat-containing protein [candidate division WOR-3 bacterium]|nr:WG repeat-containing protein [candidate division WOR-3 bacterium]